MEPDGRTIYNDIITGGTSPIEAGMWDNYFKPYINFDTYITCTTLEVVALQVLSEYGLTPGYSMNGSISSFTYGTLPDLDIKRMDALTALNYSLMEESFKGPHDRLIEAVVDENGLVNFVEVGAATVSLSDVYYAIQTGSYIETPRGVIVTGGKPVPTLKELSWHPIWEGEGTAGAPIYAAGSMLGNCMEDSWKSYATIVFSDPNLSSAFEDGIDNLYEITKDNPYDRIAGYAVYVEPPKDLKTSKTTISFSNESEIPLQIAVQDANGICPIGKVYQQPTIDNTTDANCWQDMTGNQVSYEDGVPVEIPDEFRFATVRDTVVDKFVNITGVFIIGQEVSSLYARPKDDAASLKPATDENALVWVTVDNTRRTSFKLEEKKHYAVAYKDLDGDGFQEISIVFAQEPRPGDLVTYGNGPDGTGVSFYLDPFCDLAREEGGEFSGEGPFTATILPYSKTKGIWVESIWVMAKVETPSVNVYDPDGRNNKALEIAKNLKYYLAPLVLIEPPQPIGFAYDNTAIVIDQVPQIRDNDPTTIQDFDDTPMEQAMDLMSGNGMQLTMSFLNGDEGLGDALAAYNGAAEECKEAALTLYNHMKNEVVETVYTCGPDAKPELCAKGNAGGIINSIRYNYSDQGSYTISVTEGPTILGNFTSVDGGVTQKMTEDISAKGTVTQALGDNLHFKVRIDGYGERWAVNTSHNIIRERDVVQVAIHNNPVEA